MDEGDHTPDRLTLITLVNQLMEKGASTEEIVDTIINELTPEDGAECPVCGINP